jgi:hypothetical protein
MSAKVWKVAFAWPIPIYCTDRSPSRHHGVQLPEVLRGHTHSSDPRPDALPRPRIGVLSNIPQWPNIFEGNDKLLAFALHPGWRDVLKFFLKKSCLTDRGRRRVTECNRQELWDEWHTDYLLKGYFRASKTGWRICVRGSTALVAR